jgi:hypothetical protein
MVGWDRSNASDRSHTQASPPGWEATRDISRSRTGSASALSSGATCSACSADNGPCDSGTQHATGSVCPEGRRSCGPGSQHAAAPGGLSTSSDFGMYLY